MNKLIEEVRRLAGEAPDFVYVPEHTYSGCKYTAGRDGYGCIVGQALRVVDAGLWELVRAREDSGRTVGDVSYLSEEMGSSYRPLFRELYWLRAVQGRQDSGGKWGDAVRFADELMIGFDM